MVDPCHLILGYGLSGKAAAEWLSRRGRRYYVYDTDPRVVSQIPLPIRHSQEHLPVGCSTIIRSPSFPLDHPLCCEGRARQILTLTEVELGARALQGCTWLGVTGTNGKTTTVELTNHILQQTGVRARAAGNNGTPVTQLAQEEFAGTVVLELSSFQLASMEAPLLRAGVILNLSPDHLDWHHTMAQYAAAKERLSRLLLPDAPLLIGESMHRYLHTTRPTIVLGARRGASLGWEQNTLMFLEEPVAELPSSLQGWAPHDRDNLAAAAFLAGQCGCSWQDALTAAASFQKGAHRCELVGVVQGVRWINDSKGTNLDATLRAVEASPPPLILIAGGVHKGAPYTPWCPALQRTTRKVLAIGEAGPIMKTDLNSAGYDQVEVLETLEQAVARASALARPGDTVLLSPGCSSFDQFSNYAERGDRFKELVALQAMSVLL